MSLFEIYRNIYFGNIFEQLFSSMERASRPRRRTLPHQPKNFKDRTIVFFCTEIEPINVEDTFLFMAKTARNLGHKVEIVTTHCEQEIINMEFRSMKVHQVGGLIPKSLWGYFNSPLHFMRAIYSTMWLISKKNIIKPAFVVVPTSNSHIIPLLKLLGNLYIVQILTFSELEICGMSLDELSARHSHILLQRYVKHADEIIVHNKISATVFHQLFCEPKKSVTVLYPCVNTSIFERCPVLRANQVARVSKQAVLFVCFAPIRPSSNLELAIRAFAMLLGEAKTRDRFKYLNLYLVIAGYYEDSKVFEDYSTTMQFIALGLCGKKPRVIFLNGAPLRYRKCLLNSCLAVIFPMKHSIDSRTIMEAGLMKKPVLATRSDIALELIQDGINGFLLDDTPKEFYKCMSFLVYSDYMIRIEQSRRTFSHFRRNFGMLRYSCELETIIKRNSAHVDEDEKRSS